ncbi:hypothetical protein C8Q75DRAFT_766248 [Abortiporus biennis]|nr:hypothetical protein C8Q75DRAFT_766248 [Abortiporus biennis]
MTVKTCRQVIARRSRCPMSYSLRSALLEVRGMISNQGLTGNRRTWYRILDRIFIELMISLVIWTRSPTYINLILPVST